MTEINNLAKNATRTQRMEKKILMLCLYLVSHLISSVTLKTLSNLVLSHLDTAKKQRRQIFKR